MKTIRKNIFRVLLAIIVLQIFLGSIDGRSINVELLNGEYANLTLESNGLIAPNLSIAENVPFSGPLITKFTNPLWSGYMSATHISAPLESNVNSVNGSWTVQTAPSCFTLERSVQWIGIGAIRNLNDNTLIQIGTSSACFGVSFYQAFYQIGPLNNSIIITNMTIEQGDQVHADIYQINSTNWMISIFDANAPVGANRFSKSIAYNSSKYAADFIDERACFLCGTIFQTISGLPILDLHNLDRISHT